MLRRLANGGLGLALGGVAEEELSRGEQPQGREAVDGALGVGVEGAHRLHGVAEELQAHRVVVQGREHVEDVAPHAEGAGVLDQRGVVVAHLDQLLGQGVAAVIVLEGHQLGALAHHLHRHHPLHQRPHREHQRGEASALGQVKEGLEPVGHHALVGHQLIPWEHLVGREPDHSRRAPRAFLAEEEGEVSGEGIGRVFVGGDAHQGRVERAVELGERPRTGGSAEAHRTHPSAGLERVEEG